MKTIQEIIDDLLIAAKEIKENAMLTANGVPRPTLNVTKAFFRYYADCMDYIEMCRECDTEQSIAVTEPYLEIVEELYERTLNLIHNVSEVEFATRLLVVYANTLSEMSEKDYSRLEPV